MKAEYVDHMGDDLTVVNSARVSFSKRVGWYDPELTGARNLHEADRKLVLYLARNNHWTPFSHCQITLRETVPIFTARQRFKHMVGFTYNEISRRYVSDTPTFYIPNVWHRAAQDRKQGTVDDVHIDETSSHYYEIALNICKNAYRIMVERGIAPEEARMVLPQSMYTSYYVTGSLAAWARAYLLRIDPHAQKEIQTLAKQWDEIIRPLYPVSWEALVTKSH